MHDVLWCSHGQGHRLPWRGDLQEKYDAHQYSDDLNLGMITNILGMIIQIIGGLNNQFMMI